MRDRALRACILGLALVLGVALVSLSGWESARADPAWQAITPTPTPIPPTRTIYVDSGNTSGVEDGSQAHPYNTIGEAVTAARDGDAVLVAQGTYTESIGISKSMALKGGYEPANWSRDINAYRTTIKPSGDGYSVIRIYGWHGISVVVEGVTITGARAYGIEAAGKGGGPVLISHSTITGNRGAGIYLSWVDGVFTIRANTVVSNTGWTGAGIDVWYAEHIIVADNLIQGNVASSAGRPELAPADGGGIGLWYVRAVTITGNTIINNSADRGGGIHLRSGVSIEIADNTVADNTARLGGGMYMYSEQADKYGRLPGARIRRNSIYGNSAENGGGLYIPYSSSPVIEANTIYSNTATYGGGAYIWDLSAPSFTNNIFAGNSATWGAGLYSQGSYPSLTNNTFAQNRSEGLYLAHNLAATLTNNLIVSHTAGIVASYTVTPTLSHNDVWGNVSNYSGIVTGTGDISADPLFVNPSAGDYHLRAGSPCIDAGTNAGAPSADFEGQYRPFDGDGDGTWVADIGADEYMEQRYRLYLTRIDKNML